MGLRRAQCCALGIAYLMPKYDISTAGNVKRPRSAHGALTTGEALGRKIGCMKIAASYETLIYLNKAAYWSENEGHLGQTQN